MTNPDLSTTGLDLQLINYETVAFIIYIIGYSIAIVSANQNRQVILQRQFGSDKSSNLPDPAKTIALATKITLISSIIIALTAFARLREREREIQAGTSTSSIVPNILIFRGGILSVLGNLFKAIGTQQRANEAGAQVTII